MMLINLFSFFFFFFPPIKRTRYLLYELMLAVFDESLNSLAIKPDMSEMLVEKCYVILYLKWIVRFDQLMYEWIEWIVSDESMNRRIDRSTYPFVVHTTKWCDERLIQLERIQAHCAYTRGRDYLRELSTSFVTRNTVTSWDNRPRSRATMDNPVPEPIRCFRRYIRSRSNLVEISSKFVSPVRNSKRWTCLAINLWHLWHITSLPIIMYDILSCDIRRRF